METDDVTLDELRGRAARAGLNLPDEELEKILPGVHRSRQQVGTLKALIAPDDAPAAFFHAAKSRTE